MSALKPFLLQGQPEVFVRSGAEAAACGWEGSPQGSAELSCCLLTHFHCSVPASPPARVCISGDSTPM